MNTFKGVVIAAGLVASICGGAPAIAARVHNMEMAFGISDSKDPGDVYFDELKKDYHCAVSQRSYLDKFEFFSKWMLSRGTTIKDAPNPPPCDPSAT